MQPSPLQLRSLKFLKTSISPRLEPDVYTPSSAGGADSFDFNRTRVLTAINHAVGDDDENSPTTNLLITLGITLPDDGANPPPYVCEIECVGYFAISKQAFPDDTARIDVAVVNGASMLYGAVRELVAHITSRSWYGELLLPSANFRNRAPSLEKTSGENKTAPSEETTQKGSKRPAKRKQPAKRT
jgi:preprotein translocase subunit SecB